MPSATCKSCTTAFEVEGTTGPCPRCGEVVTVDLSVKVLCSCGTTLKAPAKMRGRVIRCPKCTKSVAIPRGDEAEQARTVNVAAHILRWAFAAALVPLLVADHRAEKNIRDQLTRDVGNLVTSKEDKEAAQAATRLKEKVALLPAKKIGTAHLPIGATAPFIYAGISLAALLGFCLFAFRSKGSDPLGAAGAAAVALLAGAGAGLLVTVIFPAPVEMPGGARTLAAAALAAVLAETAKSFAAVRILRSGQPTRGSAVTLAAVAAGLGYGVGESAMVSINWLNGSAYAGSYVIHFISTPALHAAWAGMAALIFWRKREGLRSDSWMGTWIQGAGAAMVLNLLFGWFLETDAQILSLVAGLASFGAFHVLHYLTEAQEFEESGPTTIQV